jgi:hypothetical protein
MTKALIPGFLFSTVLAVAISTGAEAQEKEYIVHTFRCPANVTGKISVPAEIKPINPGGERSDSDPWFSLAQEVNVALSAQFQSSSAVGQKVSCRYKHPHYESVVYSYTVKRKLSACQGVGQREFTCRVQ